jgi:hypothetical protein
VGDGLAIRHFFRRTLRVDVDPLVICGRFGELIDPVLIDHYPIGQADLFAY